MTLRKALRASTALTVVSFLGMAATISLSMFDEAKAQTWNGAGPDYGIGTNWSTNTVPGAGETATFDDNGSAQPIVNLGGVPHSVNIWEISGGTAYTMENGSVSFGTGLTNTADAFITISADILDGSVTQNGTDILVLSGNNTYAGGTNVTSGILRATETGALGTGPVSVGNDLPGATALLELTNGFNAQSLKITNEATGFTTFIGSSAGNAEIENRQGGGTTFQNNSTAGNAIILNNVNTTPGGRPSVTLFRDTSTAGNATISLPGGDIRFQDNSTAGNAGPKRNRHNLVRAECDRRQFPYRHELRHRHCAFSG